MEQWEKDLREEIRGALKSSPPNNPKKTKLQIRPLLFFMALLLLIVNFVIIEQKQPGFLVAKIAFCVSYFDTDSQGQEPDVDKKPEVVRNPLLMALKGLDARLEALEAKDDEELKADIKTLRDKVYLLVVVQDENAAISKKILSQRHHEGKQFIHIDPDWKIDRIPTNINLTPESEEFLRKRLR